MKEKWINPTIFNHKIEIDPGAGEWTEQGSGESTTDGNIEFTYEEWLDVFELYDLDYDKDGVWGTEADYAEWISQGCPYPTEPRN